LPDRLRADGSLRSLERDRDRGDPDAGDGELAELAELRGRPRPRRRRFDSAGFTPRLYGRLPNDTRVILARARASCEVAPATESPPEPYAALKPVDRHNASPHSRRSSRVRKSPARSGSFSMMSRAYRA
jgi:hypothetical protein